MSEEHQTKTRVRSRRKRKSLGGRKSSQWESAADLSATPNKREWFVSSKGKKNSKKEGGEGADTFVGRGRGVG